MPSAWQMADSSFMKAMLRSRWVFSITLAASATLIDGARWSPAVTAEPYTAATMSSVRSSCADTGDVLAAARTKWNFLAFHPGLVGGHCIGVDPYYLTHRAEKAGYHPEVILAGRRINDGMGQRIADECVRGLLRRKGK